MFNDFEEGCAQYIVGYVANCYSNKNPHLSQTNCNEIKSWTIHISKRHLKNTIRKFV